MYLPTVKIVNGDGFAVINEADFDAEKHDLFEDAPALDLSREGIEKMKRDELVDALLAHGMDEADAEGVKVPELREKLIAAVFVGD